MSKRQVDDSDDDIVLIGGGSSGGGGGGGGGGGASTAAAAAAKPAAAKPKGKAGGAASKKAKKEKAGGEDDDDGGEEKEKKAPKKKAPVKLKPFTPEEEEIAKGASMERNAQIASFLKSVAQGYKDEAAWFKVASANKAVKAVEALTVPIRVAAELGSLDGCGKSTIEKVAEYLRGLGKPQEGFVAAHKAAEAAAGKDESFSWLADSEKDVVLDMVKKGDVPQAQAIAWHPEISEADF